MKCFAYAITLALLAGCAKNEVVEPTVASSMTLTSKSFPSGGAIPEKFSNYGSNVSPELSWAGGPSQAVSYTLIVDDPDAPQSDPFVHWLVYDIPSSTTSLEEGKPSSGKEGKGDSGTLGYYGPRPPSGNHHYHFKIYALDSMLNLPEGATKAELVRAMIGHTLAMGELIGTYSRE